MDISGKWNGYYEYGFGYYLPYFGSRIQIEVELYLDESNNLSGTVNELKSEFSVSGKSDIKGFVDKDLISFVKSYNVLPIINENNNIETLEGNLNVNHIGIIDKTNKAIYGEWQIQTEVEREDILLEGI